MSNRTHLHRVLTAAAGVSAALCLTACGGSSKPKGEASAHTSTTAAQTSSATQSSPSATTTPRSLSPAAQLQARRAALTVFVACLRKHGIDVPSRALSVSKAIVNLNGIDTKSARYQQSGAACVGNAEAVYKSATASGR